jgi:hypothetical protein
MATNIGWPASQGVETHELGVRVLARWGAWGRLVFAIPVALAALVVAPTSSWAAAEELSTFNTTPFPTSTLITGATWSTGRYSPPSNQFGDILSTSSSDDDSLFVLINDGGTGTKQPARWRNSFARVTGSPGELEFTNVGDPGPAKTYADVNSNEDLLSGPLGSYYANGFTVVDGVFYATQVQNWDWNANAPFNGLAGIAYSTDQGKHWQSPKKPFPGPTGNLNFIQYGNNAAAPDGYVYAIATEREFNASTLILGRARADIKDITNPSRWQWSSGTQVVHRKTTTVWTNSISRARPILTWNSHITYPRMSYDEGLRRYLLTFTYSYSNTAPDIWKNGSELVILESPTPAGSFSYVARERYFGPSNGYDPAFPVKWISSTGTDLWMIWAANFAGCVSGLDCSGAYGFNYRELHLTVAAKTPVDGNHERRRPSQRRVRREYVTVPRSPRPWGLGEPQEYD